MIIETYPVVFTPTVKGWGFVVAEIQFISGQCEPPSSRTVLHAYTKEKKKKILNEKGKMCFIILNSALTVV